MLELGEYFHRYILIDTQKYQWLIETLTKLNLQIEKIANFGCGEGRETFTLMCMLKAREGIGVDKNHQSIKNAEGTLETIKQIILAKGVSNDAPDFLKKLYSEEIVKFYWGNIIEPTPLQSSYDIAFCDHVLYHIWLDQGGQENTQKAIKEMARVVGASGVVVISEPTKCTGKQTFEIDFKPLFKPAHLKLVYVQIEELEQGQVTHYLCLKESTD